MSDSDEEHHLDQRLKTITSEDATRNQTTNKKLKQTCTDLKTPNAYHSHFLQKHTNSSVKRSSSLRQSLICLKQQRMKYMKTQRYSKVDLLDKQISRAKSLIVKSQVSEIKKKQAQQQRLIKKAYREEMFHFKRAWNQYFQQFRDKEFHIMLSFKQQQSKQIQKAREKLKKKCHSLRNNSKELIYLQKQQAFLQKIGDVRQLSLLKQEKQHIIQKTQVQRQQLINRWAQIQEERLTRQQSKKYATIIKRLKQNRIDQEKTYTFQRRRLKQKYKNVLAQLKHEHQMTFYYSIKWMEPK